MPYKAILSQSISEDSKVIVPISLHQDYHTGEKLRALLNAIKKVNPVILIADTLHRYNTNYEIACMEGEKFLKENKSILKGHTIIRWDKWLENHETDMKEKKALIESAYEHNSDFRDSLLRTAEKNIMGNSLEKSINYLKEEYAVILTFGQFDYILYPKVITQGWASLYQVFGNIKMPEYVNAKYQEIQAQNLIDMGVFKQERRHAQSLPTPLQAALFQIEMLLAGKDISDEAKQEFLNQLHNLTTMAEASLTQKNRKNCKISYINNKQNMLSDPMSPPKSFKIWCR